MYEAIDYTPERIPIGEKKGIVKVTWPIIRV